MTDSESGSKTDQYKPQQRTRVAFKQGGFPACSPPQADMIVTIVNEAAELTVSLSGQLYEKNQDIPYKHAPTPKHLCQS